MGRVSLRMQLPAEFLDKLTGHRYGAVVSALPNGQMAVSITTRTTHPNCSWSLERKRPDAMQITIPRHGVQLPPEYMEWGYTEPESWEFTESGLLAVLPQRLGPLKGTGRTKGSRTVSRETPATRISMASRLILQMPPEDGLPWAGGSTARVSRMLDGRLEILFREADTGYKWGSLDPKYKACSVGVPRAKVDICPGVPSDLEFTYTKPDEMEIGLTWVRAIMPAKMLPPKYRGPPKRLKVGDPPAPAEPTAQLAHEPIFWPGPQQVIALPECGPATALELLRALKAKVASDPTMELVMRHGQLVILQEIS